MDCIEAGMTLKKETLMIILKKVYWYKNIARILRLYLV